MFTGTLSVSGNDVVELFKCHFLMLLAPQIESPSLALGEAVGILSIRSLSSFSWLLCREHLSSQTCKRLKRTRSNLFQRARKPGSIISMWNVNITLNSFQCAFHYIADVFYRCDYTSIQDPLSQVKSEIHYDVKPWKDAYSASPRCSVHWNNTSVGSEAGFILRFSSLGKYDDVNCN